ncbi:unnamed protein product [Symbiodinium natans]|uniref:Uncharacterized protein n=1 Tax=Symbiodinium natans TaxID=878477 RepID=A0A812J609_9DINO|nr:unnamed protein product [Symbiodinium natans]
MVEGHAACHHDHGNPGLEEHHYACCGIVRASKNPKKWAILLAEGVGFVCDVAMCFTLNPAPFIISMCVKGLAFAISMFDGPPGTRSITTVFVTDRFEQPLQVGVYDGTDAVTWCAEKVVLLNPGESAILAPRGVVSQQSSLKQVFVRYWLDGKMLGEDMVNVHSAYAIKGRTPVLQAVCG